MTAPTLLLLDDVHEGDALPTLTEDVTPTTVVLGALASRDWRPMHHDHQFAVERNGMRDVFLSTPNQAAWFERFLTDWSGPRGRLGRMKFRMKDSVFAGDTMIMEGVVRGTETDDTGTGWAEVEVTMRVGDRVSTVCTARIALPVNPDDNPWDRRAERWQP